MTATSNNRLVVSVLVMVSVAHLLNDLLQSVIPSVYPLLKESFGLSFLQIGAITLVNNITSSIMQPVVGYYSDKHPHPFLLALGMGCTFAGLLLLAFASQFPLILVAVALVGLGSAVLHPEASRVARMASGNSKGLAQSISELWLSKVTGAAAPAEEPSEDNLSWLFDVQEFLDGTLSGDTVLTKADFSELRDLIDYEAEDLPVDMLTSMMNTIMDHDAL